MKPLSIESSNLVWEFLCICCRSKWFRWFHPSLTFTFSPSFTPNTYYFSVLKEMIIILTTKLVWNHTIFFTELINVTHILNSHSAYYCNINIVRKSFIMDHAITVTLTSPFTLGLVFIFSAQNYDFIKETEHIYYISKGSYKTRVGIYTETFSLMRLLGNLLLSSPKLRLVCKSLCKNTSDLTMYLIS